MAIDGVPKPLGDRPGLGVFRGHRPLVLFAGGVLAGRRDDGGPLGLQLDTGEQVWDTVQGAGGLQIEVAATPTGEHQGAVWHLLTLCQQPFQGVGAAVAGVDIQDHDAADVPAQDGHIGIGPPFPPLRNLILCR